MVIIGFTGTQDGLTLLQERTIVSELRKFQHCGSIAVHGDCVGGDDFFGIAASHLGYYIVTRPGLDRYGFSPKRAHSYSDYEYTPEEYISRNHKIVDESTSILACPKTMEEELRSGTWATIRYARKVGRPINIIYPYEE